jgi:hypothetical protein
MPRYHPRPVLPVPPRNDQVFRLFIIFHESIISWVQYRELFRIGEVDWRSMDTDSSTSYSELHACSKSKSRNGANYVCLCWQQSTNFDSWRTENQRSERSVAGIGSSARPHVASRMCRHKINQCFSLAANNRKYGCRYLKMWSHSWCNVFSGHGPLRFVLVLEHEPAFIASD